MNNANRKYLDRKGQVSCIESLNGEKGDKATDKTQEANDFPIVLVDFVLYKYISKFHIISGMYNNCLSQIILNYNTIIMNIFILNKLTLSLKSYK